MFVLQGFDLMLGADICYSIKALPFIFRALGRLLARRKDSLGLLGYVSRCVSSALRHLEALVLFNILKKLRQ